jgi:hypothetical protein
MAYVIREPCIGVKDTSCVGVPPEWQPFIEVNGCLLRSECRMKRSIDEPAGDTASPL